MRLHIRLLAISLLTAAPAYAQNPPPPDHPKITVKGQTYTPANIFARNMGTPDETVASFPPHKVIGNIYYVGTKMLGSFLIVTPAGNILLNSTYERTVPVVEKAVADLGFKFSDTKILLGNHAHLDHQEGDAAVKAATGAQVVAMAEDVPALKEIKPGGKEHPVDRIIHDGDTVTLGGTTLTAHLTAGHTRGCTTWTTTVRDGGRNYNVVFFCSLRSPATISAAVSGEMERTFKTVHTLPCDVPLGDHGSEYRMQAKYAALKKGGANPFIDPANCFLEADIQEAMFRAVLAEQGGPK